MAALVIVALFWIKTYPISQEKEKYQAAKDNSSLTTYSNLALEDLISKDTDTDGIFDWEESLWGTDPSKKETSPGTPDSTTVSKLKKAQASSTGTAGEKSPKEEKLTQTDQLSRELFATITSLNQNGQVDDLTIEALSAQLADKISNPSIQKVFQLSDIKIIDGDSLGVLETYLVGIDDLYNKNHGNSVTDIFKEFSNDGENVNIKALTKLDPVIKNLTNIINGLVKMSVPKKIASAHLDLVNTLERLKENISDVRLLNTDPIVAMGGIISYGKNIEALETVLNQLVISIKK